MMILKRLNMIKQLSFIYKYEVNLDLVFLYIN